MDRFLVTGGAGFIGSNICRELVSRDCFVRVVDNFLTGKKGNLAGVIERVDFVEGDMGDAQVAREAMKDIDVVLHQGALPSVPRSVDDPAATHRQGHPTTRRPRGAPGQGSPADAPRGQTGRENRDPAG